MPTPVTISAPRWPRWLGTRTWRRELPESWQQVPAARRLPVWRALLRWPDQAGRVRALLELLQLPRYLAKALSDEHVAALLDAVPWLHAEPGATPALPSFRHRRRLYYLPLPHGINLRAIEYPMADEALTAFLETGRPEHLQFLCGVLCREVNPVGSDIRHRGDVRVPLLSREEAEARAEDLRGLPAEIGIMVLTYFAGVRQYVHRAYGEWLFEQPADADDDAAPPSTTPSLGWWGLYFDVAEQGPFGNVDAVHQTSFHDLCLYLVRKRQHERQEEMRRRMASADFGTPTL